MAVTLNNAPSAGTPAEVSPGATLDWSHTVDAGSNQLLVVAVSWKEVGASAGGVFIDSVTYAGAALTFAGSVINSGNTSEIWYKVAPATGTNTVSVAPGGDPLGVMTIVPGASGWDGVHQSTPLGTVATATGSSKTPSVNVTGVSTANFVVDCHARTRVSETCTVGALQTQHHNGAGTAFGGASSREPSAAGTVTMSWSLSISRAWADCAVEIKQTPTTVLKDIILSPGVIIRPQ